MLTTLCRRFTGALRHKTSSGSPAPFAFENNLKSWLEMKKKGKAKLYLGLAMYKTGSNSSDNNEVPEWLRYDDIMKRQVLAGRASGQVSGFCFLCLQLLPGGGMSEGSGESAPGISLKIK